LNGKVQNLRDGSFSPKKGKSVAGRTPELTSMFTNIPAYKKYTLERFWQNKCYFWGINVEKGNLRNAALHSCGNSDISRNFTRKFNIFEYFKYIYVLMLTDVNNNLKLITHSLRRLYYSQFQKRAYRFTHSDPHGWREKPKVRYHFNESFLSFDSVTKCPKTRQYLFLVRN